MTKKLEPHWAARAALDHARRLHLLAFDAAADGGTPDAELASDLVAFFSAVLQLFTLSRRPNADVRPSRRGAP